MSFRCPVCSQELKKEEKIWVCPQGHTFDIAAKGYVNLLMSNSSGAKRHGDDRLMINARRDFLSKGFYTPLREAVYEALSADFPRGGTLLDAGCGECWYTSYFKNRLGPQEFSRVLKKGGGFVKAIPLEKHLWELKSAVYDAPYENEVPPHDIEGFRLVGEKKICYTFALESGKDITDLFNMTPYCYKTSQQDREKLEKLSSLTVRAQFSVLTYKKI